MPRFPTFSEIHQTPPFVARRCWVLSKGVKVLGTGLAADYSPPSAKFSDASAAMTAVSVRRINRPREASRKPQL
jgi:hypothetical protein